MLRILLYLWTALTGVKIFLYSGSRNDLINIKECVVKTIQGHSIMFNFYLRRQTNIMVRFGEVQKEIVNHYVIEAIFSDGFHETLKEHNEIKYYIDFKARRLFAKNIVLDILLNRFVTYLEHSLSTRVN